MPLATKNNAIIVKDGKLAENCDCCGGWYCDKAPDECYCICEDPLKTFPNVLLFSCTAQSWNPPSQLAGWPSPDTGGNVLLVAAVACRPLWTGSYVSEGRTINVTFTGRIDIDAGSFGQGLGLNWQGPFTSGNGLEYLQPYANTFITPSGRFSASHGKSAFKALCDGVPMSTGIQAYPATIVRGD
jgi:hypothetical protein